MGADRFIALYGVRFEVTDDAELEAIEERTDPRVVAARKAKLQCLTGRLSDGEPYFILIGTSLGCFGYQDEFQRSLTDEEFLHIAHDTRQRLKDAGFMEEPKLWLQFEGQY